MTKRKRKAHSPPEVRRKLPQKSDASSWPMPRVRGWRRDLGLLAFLYILILVLYRDVAFFNKMFVSADTIAQSAVFGKFGFDQLGAGRYPLWYPYIFSGMPFFASMSFDIFVYPVRIILHYVEQFGFHFLHYKITHFFLGGLFTYLLMRSYRLRRSSAFVAAAVFIFSPMVASLEHGNRIITIMYIPIVFYLIRRLYQRRNLSSLAWAGLAIGFQMMANHLQIVYYTWLLIGLYFLFQAFYGLRGEGGLPRVIRGGGVILAGLVIGIGVAAFLLLSIYEYAPFSIRGSGDPVAAYNFATNWSLHPKEMLTFVIPSFMGFGGQTYWGYMPFTHCPNYVGIVALFLAVCALMYRRSRTTIFFAVVGFLTILVSFGRFFPVLYKPMYVLLPFFNKFRVPAMILMLLFFCVAVLAGFGFQAIQEMRIESNNRARSGRKDRFRRTLVFLSVGLVLLGILLSLAQGPISRNLKAVYDGTDAVMGRHAQLSPQIRQQLDARRFAMAFGDIWKLLLLLAAVSLLVALHLSKKIGRMTFICLLGSLVLLDFLWIDLGLVRFQQQRGYQRVYYRSRENEVIRFLQQDPGLFRILPADELSTNEYAYYQISSVGGYHPAKLGIYQQAIEKVGFSNPNLLDLLNVKYVISRREIRHPRFQQVLETSAGSIYLNQEAMPRAFTISQVEIIEDQEKALARLGSPDFNPRKTAILERQPSFSLDPEEGGSTVRVIDYGSGEMQLETSTTGASLLVLSEIYYPAGWRAYVDGQETEIYKADYLLRAIHLPAGEHQVSFFFRPWTFRIGLWVSALFLAGILVTIIMVHRREAQSRQR